MVVSASEPKNFTFKRRKHTILFNSLLVKLIFVDTTCPCVRNTHVTHDMAFLMTNFTNQQNEKLKKFYKLLRASRKFSPFPVLSFLVNHIFVGAIAPPCPCPPPPPPRASGYASGAHANWDNLFASEAQISF